MVAASSLKNSLKINNVNVVTAAGAVVMVNEGVLVLKKTVGATTAVTLPANPSRGDHRVVKDGNGDAATYNITVSPAAGTIDGASTYVIAENYGAAIFEYNGTEWGVVRQASSTTNSSTITNLTATNGTITNLTTTNATITNPVFAGPEKTTDVAIVAATGTVIANAAAITNAVTIVTGADDAKGVILPTAVAGKQLEIYQNAATAGLKIYPPVNGTINDGTANTAIVIEGKSLARFRAINSTNWAAQYTVNS